MAKNQVFIDIVIDDKGTTKRVAVDAKKLGVELDKSAAASEKGTKNTDKLSKSTKDLDRNMRGTAKMSGNQTKEFSKMQQGMGGLVGAYATLAAQVFAVSAAFQFLSSAANLNNLIAGQEAMGSVTGRTYKTITQSIIAATDAQLKYADAAKAAAIGSAAGLTTGQLTKLGTVAKNASFALGRDLTDSFNRLIRGVTKAEPELLDELGIILRLEPATEKYAQSIGVARTELNAFQRTQAVTNEVLEQGEVKFAAIEAMMSKDAAALAQFTKSFDELINTLKRGLIQGLNPALKFLSENTLALVAVLGLVAIPIVKSILPNMDAFLDRTKKLQRAQSIAHKKRKRELKEEQAAIKKSMVSNKELLASQQQQAAATASDRGSKVGAGLGFLTGAESGMGGRGQQASRKMLDDAKAQMVEYGEIRRGQLRQYSAEELNQAEATYQQKIANANMSEKELQAQKKLTAAESAKLNKKMGDGYQSFGTRVVGIGRLMAKGLNAAFAAVAIFGMLSLAFELIKKIISVMNPLTEKQKEEEEQAKKLTAVYKQLNEELERNANVRRDMLGTGASLQNKGQSMQGIDMKNLINNINSQAIADDRGSDAFLDAQEQIKKTIQKAIDLDDRFEALRGDYKDGIIPESVATNMRKFASDIIETGQNLGNLPQQTAKAVKSLEAFGASGVSNTPIESAIKDFRNEVASYDKALTDVRADITAANELKFMETTRAAISSYTNTIAKLEDLRDKAAERRDKSYGNTKERKLITTLDGAILKLIIKRRYAEEELSENIEGQIKLKKQGIDVDNKQTVAMTDRKTEAQEILDILIAEDKRQKASDAARRSQDAAFIQTRAKGLTIASKIYNLEEERNKLQKPVEKAFDDLKEAQAFLATSNEADINAKKGAVKLAKERFEIAEATRNEGERLLDDKERELEIDLSLLKIARQRLELLDKRSSLQRQLSYSEGTSGGSLESRSNIRDIQGQLLTNAQTEAQANFNLKEPGEALARKEMLADERLANGGRALDEEQIANVETQLRLRDESAHAERIALANATNNLNIHNDVNKAIHDTNKAKIEGLEYDAKGAGFLGEAKILNELMRDARLANPDYVFNEANLNNLKEQAAKINELTTLESQRSELALSIQGGMETAFMSIIDGSKSAKQAFGDMAKSILASIAQMIVKMLVLKMLQTAMPSLFGKSGGTTTPDGVPMGRGEQYAGYVKKGGIPFPMAKGGYSLNKHNYSRGGMARGAQSGYAATLHGNEAVVPLPDNRSIPVTLNGAGGQNNNVTVNVAMDSSGNVSQNSQQDGAQAGKLGSMIAAAVQQELQFQKRSGGILNPYGVS